MDPVVVLKNRINQIGELALSFKREGVDLAPAAAAFATAKEAVLAAGRGELAPATAWRAVDNAEKAVKALRWACPPNDETSHQPYDEERRWKKRHGRRPQYAEPDEVDMAEALSLIKAKGLRPSSCIILRKPIQSNGVHNPFECRHRQEATPERFGEMLATAAAN